MGSPNTFILTILDDDARCPTTRSSSRSSCRTPSAVTDAMANGSSCSTTRTRRSTSLALPSVDDRQRLSPSRRSQAAPVTVTPGSFIVLCRNADVDDQRWGIAATMITAASTSTIRRPDRDRLGRSRLGTSWTSSATHRSWFPPGTPRCTSGVRTVDNSAAGNWVSRSRVRLVRRRRDRRCQRYAARRRWLAGDERRPRQPR